MTTGGATIYHNPACGTSRNTLEMLRAGGIEPRVVEYLKTGWTAEKLKSLFKAMGVTPRQVLRIRGTDAEARGLTEPNVSDETIIAAMVENPVLVERPIVVTSLGAALCRPKERVLDLVSPETRKTIENNAL